MWEREGNSEIDGGCCFRCERERRDNKTRLERREAIMTRANRYNGAGERRASADASRGMQAMLCWL